MVEKENISKNPPRTEEIPGRVKETKAERIRRIEMEKKGKGSIYALTQKLPKESRPIPKKYDEVPQKKESVETSPKEENIGQWTEEENKDSNIIVSEINEEETPAEKRKMIQKYEEAKKPLKKQLVPKSTDLNALVKEYLK